jgi:hypothetical protein
MEQKIGLSNIKKPRIASELKGLGHEIEFKYFAKKVL